MEAKLIKVTDDIGVYYVLNGSNLPDNYVLSNKNCQAIKLGYDLDELADFYSTMTVFFRSDEVPTEKQIEDAEYISEIAFKAGFQKAFELMGDKKFSEEDMINAHYNAWIDRGEQITYPESRNKYFKSLQQTEWDVEIEMEEVAIGDKYTPEPKPKLDADGCLILKLKSE